jgi:hypothetical protein
MIRVAITAESFDAIAKTMSLGSVGCEAKRGANGEALIWLESRVVAKLKFLRGPGESYGDLIVRLAKERRREP